MKLSFANSSVSVQTSVTAAHVVFLRPHLHNTQQFWNSCQYQNYSGPCLHSPQRTGPDWPELYCSVNACISVLIINQQLKQKMLPWKPHLLHHILMSPSTTGLRTPPVNNVYLTMEFIGHANDV